jgi:hypothetical protein
VFGVALLDYTISLRLYIRKISCKAALSREERCCIILRIALADSFLVVHDNFCSRSLIYYAHDLCLIMLPLLL